MLLRAGEQRRHFSPQAGPRASRDHGASLAQPSWHEQANVSCLLLATQPGPLPLRACCFMMNRGQVSEATRGKLLRPLPSLGAPCWVKPGVSGPGAQGRHMEGS